MAIARLPVILVLVVLLLQSCQGQQCLCSNSNLGFGNSFKLSSEPVIGLITPVKRNNQNNCKCGSNGSSSNSPLNGLKQFLNPQQPQQTGALNFQTLSSNLQSQLGAEISQQQQSLQPQNLQQSVIPQKQPIISKPSAHSQLLNKPPTFLQSPHQQELYESTKQSQNLQMSLNLQPISLEKNIQPQLISDTSQSKLLNNFQATGTPKSTQKDISLEFLPTVNNQVQGLPSQVTQGVLLSNLGLSSNIPSILPSSCTKSSTGHLITSQNNAAAFSSAPVSLDASSKDLPMSAPVSYSMSDYAPNKPTPVLLVPLSFQSDNMEPIPQTLDLTLSPVSTFQCQQPLNQVNLRPQQPIRIQKGYQVNEQPAPSSIQSYPVKNEDLAIQQQNIPYQVPYQAQFIQSQSTPSQPVPFSSDPPSIKKNQLAQETNSTLVQNQQMPFDRQSNPLPSLLLSKFQPSNTPAQGIDNQGSKSSSMKSLLPLLFDLLKEKNECCRCPNCNCGCMSNYQDLQGMDPCMNNPFSQSYYNPVRWIPNPVQRIEKQEEPSRNTYLVINDTPQKADNEKNIELKPHITDSYANQIKYGKSGTKDLSENIIRSEEIGFTKKVEDKKKALLKEHQSQDLKKLKNDESAEYDDDDYSYENED